jgi:hypothetical protein
VRFPRTRFPIWGLMLLVTVLALAVWAEQMWRKRESYLKDAAPHAQMEAFYSELALDIAGVPRQPPSLTASAILPDGTALHFAAHGPVPQIYYPLGTKNVADEATVKRLRTMCKQEAVKEGALKRMYERNASHPWMPFDLAPIQDPLDSLSPIIAQQVSQRAGIVATRVIVPK